MKLPSPRHFTFRSLAVVVLAMASQAHGADAKRRDNPNVLPITELQADFVWAKILALDIHDAPDGKQLVGVVMKGDVELVPLDPEKLEGKRFAWTIYPRRMIVVNAAFPYKAQVEEVRKALKLEKVADVFSVTNATPYFRGFVVERQVLRPGGGVETPWKVHDVEQHYRETIYPRKVGDSDEPPGLRAAMLNEDHELVMPLPILLTGRYPAVRLKSIDQTIEKDKRRGKQPKARDGPADAKLIRAEDLPEAILFRFIDTDVAPGRRYQYRVKVRMQNPNWVGEPADNAKYDLVGRAADADIKILEGPFVKTTEPVAVPPELHIYTTGAPATGRVQLQIQRWFSEASVGKHKVPVGDWVVVDVAAGRGTYVGKEQLVKLPTWTPIYNCYVLHEAPANLDPKWGKPRYGVLIDPIKPGPNSIVVDVAGGPQEWPGASGPVSDESAAEVLLLDEAGNLQVRNSAADLHDPERIRREQAWRGWVQRTEKETDSLRETPKKPRD